MVFGLFLQSLGALTEEQIAALVAVFAGLFLFIVVASIVVYVYTSFVYMAIGKRAKHKSPGIAWIPIVGKPILSANIARMHWWPLLLLFVGVFPFSLFASWLIAISWIASIVFTVYWFIWTWKMLEKVNRPGWWVLFNLIPIAGWIVFWILLGIAAWGKR